MSIFRLQKMLRNLLMRKDLLLVLKLRMPEKQFGEWKRPLRNKNESLGPQESSAPRQPLPSKEAATTSYHPLCSTDMDELMKEVQEARRIKMLHQPSKVMDMEHELLALRLQLAEKSKHSLQLQKEVHCIRSIACLVNL
ncbi:Stomatal closure-related actin-binding protein 1 [Vitis vinifera]|uniref:Stomatal closure-related actin-binding protein 1 n=1 Tax=Vitis vinifera TaxID=29760 RepID=A0A438DII7_VITVI|nr:Stomatal closure-related actin-binding protein 1 [Vitis vinifera]